MSPERLKEFIAEYIGDEYDAEPTEELGLNIWENLVYHYGLTPSEVKWLGLAWLNRSYYDGNTV